MKLIHKSKSSLILIELTCAILFFAIASGVCVRVFTAAHMTSRKSSELSFAMIQVQNAAELTKNSGGNMDYFNPYLDGEEADNGNFITYYDKDMEACGKADASYRMEIRMEEADRMLNSTICFYKTHTEEEIFSLDVKKYLG